MSVKKMDLHSGSPALPKRQAIMSWNPIKKSPPRLEDKKEGVEEAPEISLEKEEDDEGKMNQPDVINIPDILVTQEDMQHQRRFGQYTVLY